MKESNFHGGFRLFIPSRALARARLPIQQICHISNNGSGFSHSGCFGNDIQ